MNKDEELVFIKDWDNRVTYNEALELAKKEGGRLATNNEIDEYLQGKNVNKDYFPCWTGTYVSYKGTNCTVTELGKTYKIKLPLSLGWYKKDKFGIPSGKKSNSKDKNARYLYRIEENECSIVRGFGIFGFRRGVYVLCRCDNVFAVAIVRKKQTNKIKETIKPRFYMNDLNNYNSEFLIEIIEWQDKRIKELEVKI